MHGEHGVYVPELIFGHLLTSSNYDDDEKKGAFGALQLAGTWPEGASEPAAYRKIKGTRCGALFAKLGDLGPAGNEREGRFVGR